jgi:Protein of unknown function (DUF1460)
MIFESTFNRRHFLHLLAGSAALLAAGPAQAGETRIARLIGQAQRLPLISQRIDFISRALIGTRYRAYTLIGGPRAREQFVMRDDCFDCVTFCETVLAAAMVREPEEFAAALRQIRYRDGEVSWRERNHYFSQWGVNNTAAGICALVKIPGSESVAKTLTEMRALGPMRTSFDAIPRDSMLANKTLLATGDIVAFVSQRSDLDVFHVGFVIVAGDGDLWLRHAAQSRGRVVEQPLAPFLKQYRVQAVTLLRPRERADEDVIV